jgi:hypothetical protein
MTRTRFGVATIVCSERATLDAVFGLLFRDNKILRGIGCFFAIA